MLRYNANEVAKVTAALRHLLRQKKGAASIRLELGYVRNNRHHMDDAYAAAAGFGIGSGTVAAANEVLVTTRMRHSGQTYVCEWSPKPLHSI